MVAFEGKRTGYPRQLGSDADLITFRTLHTASLVSPALCEGLNPESLFTALEVHAFTGAGSEAGPS